jgi:hypothetical protein
MSVAIHGYCTLTATTFFHKMTTCKLTAISSYQSKETVHASEVCSFEHVTLPEILVPDEEEVIKALFG